MFFFKSFNEQILPGVGNLKKKFYVYLGFNEQILLRVDTFLAPCHLSYIQREGNIICPTCCLSYREGIKSFVLQIIRHLSIVMYKKLNLKKERKSAK